MTDQNSASRETIDLGPLSLEELRGLYRELPGIIRARESADRAARIERVLATAKVEGMNRDEIRSLRATLMARERNNQPCKRNAGAEYRDPNTGAIWSGKGRKPAWIKAHEASGRDLEELRLG